MSFCFVKWHLVSEWTFGVMYDHPLFNISGCSEICQVIWWSLFTAQKCVRSFEDHFCLFRNMSGYLRITFLRSEISQVIWGSFFFFFVIHSFYLCHILYITYTSQLHLICCLFSKYIHRKIPNTPYNVFHTISKLLCHFLDLCKGHEHRLS